MKRNSKVSSALHVLMQFVDDDILVCILNVRTSEEAWGMIVGLFSKEENMLVLTWEEDRKLGARWTLCFLVFLCIETVCRDLFLVFLGTRSRFKLRRLSFQWLLIGMTIVGWVLQLSVDELENMFISYDRVLVKIGTLKWRKSRELCF